MSDNLNVISTLGTCLFYADTTPTTYDKAGFDALTWIEVGEVTDFGEVGGERSVGTHVAVKDGVTRKRSGPIDYGQMSTTFGKDITDVGQIALDAAVEDGGVKSVKILDPDGLNYEAFTSIVTSFKTTRGDVTAIRTGSSNFDITAKPTYFSVA